MQVVIAEHCQRRLALFGVTRGTVVRWIELRLLKAFQIMPGAQ